MYKYINIYKYIFDPRCPPIEWVGAGSNNITVQHCDCHQHYLEKNANKYAKKDKTNKEKIVRGPVVIKSETCNTPAIGIMWRKNLKNTKKK